MKSAAQTPRKRSAFHGTLGNFDGPDFSTRDDNVPTAGETVKPVRHEPKMTFVTKIRSSDCSDPLGVIGGDSRPNLFALVERRSRHPETHGNMMP